MNTYDVSRYEVFWLPTSVASGIQGGHRAPQGARSRAPRQGQYRVIYVNGQLGNPDKHRSNACALAVVTGGPVIGVYNASSGLLGDTWKSADLKTTSFFLMKQHVSSMRERSASQIEIERSMLARMKNDCPASESLLKLLLKPEFGDARIVGHSQGNLIICNVLNALIASRGAQSISRMKVYAIASPTTFWEEGVSVTRFNMKNDFVGWLSLDRPTMESAFAGLSSVTSDTSQDRSGLIVGFNPSVFNRLTHDFYLYLAKIWDDLCPMFP
ncbi:MAG: hypothetical protein U0800_18160 [Isosphaeraceae bacterium]